jgi:DNA-binding MarR family transcriptional regulator
MPSHLIRRAQQIAEATFISKLAPTGITSTQFVILNVVGCSPDIELAGVVRQAGIDRTTVSESVERLVEREIIRRTRDRRDRRKKLLCLTDAGEILLHQTGKLVEDVQDQMLYPLTAQERQIFLSALSTFVAANNHVSRSPLIKL